MSRARRFSREIAIAFVLSLAAIAFFIVTGFREGGSFTSNSVQQDALHLSPGDSAHFSSPN